MILKARILNKRDDFILVKKIVLRNVLKGLSMRRRSINQKTKQFQVHQDCNVILQRPEYAACSESSKSATKQQSRGDRIDFMPSLACFGNCLAFYCCWRAGWGTEETQSLRHPILYWYPITLWRPLQSQILISTRIIMMISGPMCTLLALMNFQERHVPCFGDRAGNCPWFARILRQQS